MGRGRGQPRRRARHSARADAVVALVALADAAADHAPALAAVAAGVPVAGVAVAGAGFGGGVGGHRAAAGVGDVGDALVLAGPAGGERDEVAAEAVAGDVLAGRRDVVHPVGGRGERGLEVVAAAVGVVPAGAGDLVAAGVVYADQQQRQRGAGRLLRSPDEPHRIGGAAGKVGPVPVHVPGVLDRLENPVGRVARSHHAGGVGRRRQIAAHRLRHTRRHRLGLGLRRRLRGGRRGGRRVGDGVGSGWGRGRGRRLRRL